MDLARWKDVAERAVRAAAETSLRHFGAPLQVERKADRTPVTLADRESEAAILREIRAACPEDTILTEESGLLPGRPDRRWIVDPLDGTRGFARGGSFWGPIVGFELEGRIVAGAIALPALGETWVAARGMGCWRNGERARVSTIERWEEATLSVGELQNLLRDAGTPAIEALVRGAAAVRGYGDLGGCAMLLAGRAEAWLEAGVKSWDIAALAVLVEEAGGRFTDFGGRPSIASGTAVASNGLVHDHVLAALAQT